MWDETTRQRFSSLRSRERQGVLTAEERNGSKVTLCQEVVMSTISGAVD
jgi:hypothetical protein